MDRWKNGGMDGVMDGGLLIRIDRVMDGGMY